MFQPFDRDEVTEGRFRLKTSLRLMALCGVLGATALLSACSGGDDDDATTTTATTTLSCDDSLKTSFTQDASALGGDTKVLLVKQFKKGDELVLPNSSLASGVTPLTAPADMCLVKLVVGPGLTSEPTTAPSWSQGIGIEVWLPEKSAWNERIRAYGTGGAGGGFHTDITKLGPNRGEGNSFHVAAAGKGYVVSHSDAGHVGGSLGNFTGGTLTWAMKVDGTPNTVLWKDYSERSMHVQAITTKALTKAYYGKEQKYAYWDGQSMGGRQGYKLVQKYPTDFDGYLIGAPAINQSKMQLEHLWPQVVANVEFGSTIFPAAKSNFISAQAVKACSGTGIDLVIDPLSCKYDPTKDAAALCNGVAGNGVTGTNSDTGKCVTLAEANAYNKIWYGWTRDGSVPDPTTYGNGMATALAADKGQLWYGITRGTNLTGIKEGGTVPSGPQLAVFKPDNSPATLATDYLALVMENPAYGWTNFTNATGNGQSKFLELNYASFAYAYDKALAMNDLYFSQANTDDPDLSAARDSNRKILHYHGWNDEVIAPAGSINYWERVAGYMGGKAELQKFNRLYMIPGYAHDSTFSRSGQIDPSAEYPVKNKVPLPQPSAGRDELFTAMMNWVESGTAPDRIEVSSADSSISMPICVYPLKATYNGTGNVKAAASYTCK
ncbi:tannase/feruloyl esterase family alpha/beta hydrolase [Propionivibrio limicola]|uniref:tannase/feruloyl esterase family alpha/beta hydrolase n=1 Tax=Propionivibrio limicola TaxID=167645 RepID=UPI001B87CCFC|nr:tannase/feruloyl esterase family alpha/beta hydrolase [Propionivibrio limicola]